MKQKSVPGKAPADQIIKDIRRQTRRHYSAEEKIRIVLEGLRGEENISELCRREGRLDVLRLVQGVPGGRQAPVGR
jgi:transposase